MSDSDDQDKTRIFPRKRKLSARRGAQRGEESRERPQQASSDRPRGRRRPSGDRPQDGRPPENRPPDGRPPQRRPADNRPLFGSEDSTVFGVDEMGAEQRVQAAQNVRDRLRASGQSEDSMAVKTTVQGQSTSLKNYHAHDILKGRFVLERVLGAGGMGVVYKAKDLLKVEAKDRDPYVAIKVLGDEFKSHPEAFIALQRESRKTQRIAHPNIVNVHDFDKDGDTVFMTMEFLEGIPLDKLLKKYRNKGLPEADVWQILSGLCAALAYAHEQNIIHSDLKPGNIFITHASTAKVFDFGIARAVAKAEQGDALDADRTVFDAGNLGALTPAYASLEMLEGDPPDVRDDIYALGCIAYELFTGEHPFRRKNAKEAKRAKLKARKINNITKAQWRAIEHALAFDREDRVPTIKDFWNNLTDKYSRPYMLWATLSLVILIGAAVVYEQWTRMMEPPAPVISEEDFRVELETKIRQELIEENIKGLVAAASFDSRWEASIRQQVQDYSELLGAEHPSVLSARGHVYQLYLEQIEEDLSAKQYSAASKHIENARRYSAEQQQLNTFDAQIAAAKEALEESKLKAAEESARQARLAQEEKERQQRLAAQRQQQRQQQQQVSQRDEQRQDYDRALGNIKEQLRCRQLLDMKDFANDVRTLQRADGSAFRKDEGSIAKSLAACITKIGRNFPDRAKASLADAKAIFNNHSAFAEVQFKSKDRCNKNLAGLGARGRRSMCQDDMQSGGRAPPVVVIPAQGDTPAFAIGRYEVSIDELNRFCLSTRSCSVNTSSSSLFPATDISLQTVKDYLAWLSRETGQTYRLPTTQEWVYAAKAKGRGLDANRNCYLDARGVQKGGGLISASIGQQNGWGLVNYVGNASELAAGEGGRLMLVGGSYKTDMEECDFNWRRNASSKADPEVGFRIVRELK